MVVLVVIERVRTLEFFGVVGGGVWVFKRDCWVELVAMYSDVASSGDKRDGDHHRVDI